MGGEKSKSSDGGTASFCDRPNNIHKYFFYNQNLIVYLIHNTTRKVMYRIELKRGFLMSSFTCQLIAVPIPAVATIGIQLHCLASHHLHLISILISSN